MCVCVHVCVRVSVVSVWVCVCVRVCLLCVGGDVCARVCACACVCVVCVCVFVGSCLATKVFIGNLPAVGRGWVIIKLVNDE